MASAEASPQPVALEITPDGTLQFVLTRGGTGESSTPKCTMTLTHPGPSATTKHLAFKVKTTQPRRYLVRPNQGLVAPGGTETVSILLVEKDKVALLQSYDRLGQSALDHSKDKFLVQSTAVSNEFAEQHGSKVGGNKTSKELAEALTSMWNSAGGAAASQSIINKKLHVKHVVMDSGGAGGADAAIPGTNSTAPATNKSAPPPAMDSMSPEQMFAEVSTLRRKYDELVAFSVNLTAERDILNNTLEQTKRDLNREMALRASLENRAASGGSMPTSGTTEIKSGGGGGGLSLVQVLVVALVCFFCGSKLGTDAHEQIMLFFTGK